MTAIPQAKSGVGFYVLNLLKALSEVDRNDTYYVYTKKEDRLLVEHDPAHFNIIPCSTNNRLLRLGWEQMFLPHYISRDKLDVFHSPHYTIPLRSKAPTVSTFHDMTFFSHPEVHEKSKVLFFRQMIPLAAERADAIIAVSQSTKKDMVRFLDLPESKIHVVYEGIDSEEYRPLAQDERMDNIKRQYKLPEEFVLFVGTLEPRKNIDGAIRAFKQVTEETGKKFGLVVTGGKGWNYHSIFNLVQELDIEDDVRFTGYVPEEDLPYLFNAATVFAYPSFYEGFGIPPLEAMACGTPVVASNVSSVPEVVGDAGLLVDPSKDEEIAGAILRILTDPDLRSELSAKGLERTKLFSWQKAAKETLKIYNSVV
jgi:glycosyltransferase involved in cell wall biosynthesis